MKVDAYGGKCEVWKFKSEWWKKLVEEVAVQSAAQHRQQASKHVSAGSRRIRHNFHRHQSQREGPAQSEEKAASYRAYRAGTGFAAWPGWTSAVVSERPSKPTTPTLFLVSHCQRTLRYAMQYLIRPQQAMKNGLQRSRKKHPLRVSHWQRTIRSVMVPLAEPR